MSCPEILLEGPLGESLHAADIASLLCVHRLVAAMSEEGAGLLLWGPAVAEADSQNAEGEADTGAARCR